MATALSMTSAESNQDLKLSSGLKVLDSCGTLAVLACKWYVVTSPLPNVTHSIARNFAGNVPVNRANHPNNTLFFWAFEKDNGSLTGPLGPSNEPWIIWLNVGPGSSSMLCMMTEASDIVLVSNPELTAEHFQECWSKLADTFWVDQPVGTGCSISDPGANAANEDQVGEDFVSAVRNLSIRSRINKMGFLSNLVKIFPTLAHRPLYSAGESYTGDFFNPLSACHMRKIAIGDGTIGKFPTFEGVPILNIIETYPQLIEYDPEVFEYLKRSTTF
ncbi:Alpha/Beta hydrolase protein [Mycena capillaripes]|nr:Alpha/Beta hydrolase protein [Mycena capillaripes]